MCSPNKVRPVRPSLLMALWERAAQHSTFNRGTCRVSQWYFMLACTVFLIALLLDTVLRRWQCLSNGNNGLDGCSQQQRHIFLLQTFFLFTAVRLSLVLALPIPSESESASWVNDPAFTERIGVLVPCHLSAAEIGDTLRAIVRHIPPRNVVVVDNANAPEPPDTTEKVVAAIDPQITYMYEPTGHKTNALAVGMAKLPQECTYALRQSQPLFLCPLLSAPQL